MTSRFTPANVLKAVYAAWLLWAWIATIPLLVRGAAALVSLPMVLLVLFSVLVLGLFRDHPVAWLVSPVPAAVVAFFGVPWVVLNVGTALGYEWYHDSPGLLTTLWVGAALPGAALALLAILLLEWRRVLGIFLRRLRPSPTGAASTATSREASKGRI